jgi:predicted O-methyltransferase YrrM
MKPEKGAILDRFLMQSLDRHYAATSGSTTTTTMTTMNQPRPQKKQPCPPFAVVEIGTYCGYSTIRIAHTILQWMQQATAATATPTAATATTMHDDNDETSATTTTTTSTMDFHIFTVDVNPPTVAIARQLVSMAGLAAHVTFLMLSEKEEKNHNIAGDDDDGDDSLSKIVQSALLEKYKANTKDHHQQPALATAAAAASFVFLDHAKDKYLSDLKQLEKSKIIRGGSTSVAADNVIFHRLDDYRNHMREYANRGIVETRLEMGHLEYTSSTVDSTACTAASATATTADNFCDGLELTYYLKDPY